MNMIQTQRKLAQLIAGLENGFIDAPALDVAGLRFTYILMLEAALMPQIDGNTTVDDLLVLDDDEAWQDAALDVIRQAKPNATYADLPDLDRLARRLRSVEKWVNSVADRDGIRVADYA